MTVQEIYDAVIDYDDEQVAELVQAELAAGTDSQKVVQEGLVAALGVVGQRFSDGTLFVPEMLLAADAVKAGLAILKPVLADTGAEPVGTVVVGTVKGDLHDIGKNLVAMMLEGAGFRIIELGVDVAAESFIEAAQENEADIVGMSDLLTTAMPEMEKSVAAVSEANQTRNLSVSVSVMLGGPPVNQDFADRIGADGYGIDAHKAVALARKLVA